MHFVRRFLARRRVEELIREGVGVHEACWRVPAGEGDHHRLVEPILQWVRDSMVGMRRPYGIDHVALALACRDARGQIRCSNSSGVIRPAAFYSDDGRARIAAFLDDVDSVPADARTEVVAAVLSLGDLAYELDLPKAA
jgi:hypothetical protein